MAVCTYIGPDPTPASQRGMDRGLDGDTDCSPELIFRRLKHPYYGHYGPTWLLYRWLTFPGYLSPFNSKMSWFKDVESAPPIEVFALNRAYLADKDARRTNMGVGAYRTEEGLPWVLPVVRKVEEQMAADHSLNHEYLPVLGLESFTTAAVDLLLGKNATKGIAFGVQSLSGTGALRIGAEFLSRILKLTTFYYSNPTWENHGLVFRNAGFTEGRQYRYWDAINRSLDFNGMLEDLRSAPERSVIILHACAHNPTGMDLNVAMWEKIADVVVERRLFPFFDSAYQGFASGDPEKDAFAVRYFVSRGIELFCAQSFAKNFGLYNERVGNLTIVMPRYEDTFALEGKIKSQITLIIRGNYSNPPNHGARIVSTILNDKDLYQEWKECIVTMSNRIFEMRELLQTHLRILTGLKWCHITSQIGMFSYLGITAPQVLHLKENHHIYMLQSGRISMCGITKANVKQIAEAIHETLHSVPEPGLGCLKCSS